MDWGVVNFVTLSDGEVVDQCQPLKKFLPKLASCNARMARKKKFSENWRKAEALYHQVACESRQHQKGFLRTQGLEPHCRSNVVVVIEDLQVENMSKSATKKVAQKSRMNR